MGSHRGGSLMLAGLALTIFSCLARARGSAIPMWEFLARGEKMSHLYRIFSQEVSQYCADSSMPDCNKNLLVTGLKNLANLDEDQLDEMDPYQRGAKDIIWRAMIGNNRQTSSRLGQQVFHADDVDPLAVGDNELPQESSASHDYVRPSEHSGPYLVGPMVIRVYPDGRPVPSDAQRPLPQDEDIEDIRYNAQLPSIGDFDTSRPSSALAAAAEQQQQQQQHLFAKSTELPREMLPPRQAAQPIYQRYALVPSRYYSRLLRPRGSLQFRERFYN